jgi:hypothetical protein
MSELITINPATGEEDELLAVGTWDEMAELRDETIQDSEDTGGEWPILMIQPAQ